MSTKPILKLGSKGDAVIGLQRLLSLYPDGIFGELTLEAVKKFQRAHGLNEDGIVGAKTWAQLAKVVPTENVPTVGNEIAGCTVVKSKRKISLIVVHSTATREGQKFTVNDIRNWHKEKGYSDIGYHYVIYTDGSLHLGRNINLHGAHARGHNYGSIGIVYVGGKTKDGTKAKDTRTDEQKRTLLALLKLLRTYYPTAKIYGHRDVNNTECPSFDARVEYKQI